MDDEIKLNHTFDYRSQEQNNNNHSKDILDAAPAKKTIAKQSSTEDSAIVIQKIWRGYTTRKATAHIAKNLQTKRTQQHIE